MSDSTWSFSQTFASEFQTSRAELESRVDLVKAPITADALNTLSSDLAKLTKTLADATGSVPSYDQRQYELQLKSLEKSLENLRASLPKSKFAFKRKAPAASSSIPPSPVPRAVPDAASQQQLSSISTNPTLSSHSFRYLSRDSLPSASQASDLTISDLNSCIVNLLPAIDGKPLAEGGALEISALHIRNLTDTILLLPVIRGSVLLHDLRRCILVVGCHQFRMHTSTDVDVYLSIPSTPIIEHCSRIRFTSYPTALSPKETYSNFFSVQDFSHIKATPSPNWSAMPTDALVRRWPVSTISSEKELTDILDTLLPR
ncbi:tubulin binding cofactor C-domain-containing protein [Mycena belliarum]|uniref:Tubulin binding cofactor C-domain-containing protein n=1 Tax=Mycena belliarum TaxID=1033014 RepID=A0AAD6TQL0_9AGAR|nr:tubulin binding cofactor C-domain-containing protein [Mycena belliae]